MSGGEIASLVSNRWRCNVSERDGTVLLMPIEPEVARSNYVRREPLEDLIKAVVRDKTLTIEVAARYAAEQEGNLAFWGLERCFVLMIVPTGSNYKASDMLMFQQAALRFVGSLSASDWALATSDTGVQPRQMSRAAGRALAAWLFRMTNRVYGLHHASREETDPEDRPIDAARWIEDNASSALPSGIPDGSTVRIRYETEDLMYMKHDGQRTVSSEVMEHLSRFMLWPAGVDRQYQPTQLTRLVIELRLGPDVSADYPIEQVPPIRSDWVGLTELPETIRNQVLDQIRIAEQNRLEHEQARRKKTPPPN